MITYKWKAEFNGDEIMLLEFCQKYSVLELDKIWTGSKLDLIAEMANALDRYEAILNEMEKERHSE